MGKKINFYSIYNFSIDIFHPVNNMLHTCSEEYINEFISNSVNNFCVIYNIKNKEYTFEFVSTIINEVLTNIENEFKPIKDIYVSYMKHRHFTIESYGSLKVGSSHIMDLKYLPNFNDEVNSKKAIHNEYLRLKSTSNIKTIDIYVSDFNAILKTMIILAKSGNIDYFNIKQRFIDVINEVCETNPFNIRIPLYEITHKNPYGLECDKNGYPYKVSGCHSSLQVCINSHKCGVCDKSPY